MTETNEVKTEKEQWDEISAANGVAIELMLGTGYFSDEELAEDTRLAVEQSQSFDDDEFDAIGVEVAETLGDLLGLETFGVENDAANIEAMRAAFQSE
jgi:hypothetical protein